MTPRALKRWRQSMEFTQAEFAEELGVSRTTVNRWEGGLQAIPKSVQLVRDWRERALERGEPNFIHGHHL